MRNFIFQDFDLRQDMTQIERVLHRSIGRLMQKDYKQEDMKGERREELSNVLKVAFHDLRALAQNPVYGRLSRASDVGRNSFIFPYFGRGFVKYEETSEYRRCVVYRNNGVATDVKQYRSGAVELTTERYQNIRGIVTVNDNWMRYLKKKKDEEYKKQVMQGRRPPFLNGKLF